MITLEQIVKVPGALVGVYGTGGFGREVMPVAQLLCQSLGMDQPQHTTRIVFVEATPRAPDINGMPVISEHQFINATDQRRYFVVCVADAAKRRSISESLIASGAIPMSLVAPNTTVYHGNEIGEGAVICAHATITSNARIGKFFHCNIYAYVAHDCILGDYVTFAPRVSCNGNIHIGDNVYVGTSAVLRQGQAGKPLIIGEGATIGMGAVVTKDVAPYTVVVGNPARPMKS
jgi:sugar O-acyltransferase (sialic acid O-acetyltransferase NeuD family)